MTKKTYMRTFYPGSFVAETIDELVKDRNPPTTRRKGAYAFRFYDIEEHTIGDELLKGQPKNWSGTYYYGKKMSLIDVKREMPHEQILISNMETNGFEHVVKTVRGNFQFFDNKKDVVIE